MSTREMMQSAYRGCVRSLAVVAIVLSYGLAQGVSLVGISGLALTASTKQADAQWGWGWGRGGWGRGGWGRGGWGRGGWGRGGWGRGGWGRRGW
jgi:hypothetical protein